MVILMIALMLLAVFVGALAFVTSPVGLTLAAVIAAWLLVYGGRTLLARRNGEAARRG